MAFSNSIVRAQNVIICSLCETDPKLKWKCIECEFLMCNNCKEKIHSKFKHAQDHTIIDIKEVGKDDFVGVKCHQHSEVTASRFCIACKQISCQSCEANDHSGHQLVSIKEGYDVQIQRLRIGLENFGTRQKECKSIEEAIDYLQSEEAKQNISQKLVQDIETQKELLKRDIDTYADQLKDDVQTQITLFREQTKNERILEVKKFINDQIAKADDLIHTKDKSNFFVRADEFFKDANILPTNISLPPTIKFVPTKASKTSVGIFAHEYFRDTVNVQMKVLRKFSTELDECTCMTVVPNGGYLWLGDGKNKTVQRFNMNGQSLLKVIVNVVVNDIQVRLPDCTLMACGKQNLMLINETNGLLDSSGINAGSLNIISAHVTIDQHIVVGAKSPGPSVPIQGKRLVIFMDREGNHLKVFENDMKGDRLFSFPKKITSTVNGNLFIIDLFSTDFKCKVKTITQEGVVLSIYIGNPDINNELRPFTSTDIASSQGDKVIVCDFPDYFHILSDIGEPLSLLNTRRIGIDMAYCLTFQSQTILYVGNSPRGADRTKADVYEVEYSE